VASNDDHATAEGIAGAAEAKARAAEAKARAAVERASETRFGRIAPRLFEIWSHAGADLLAGGLTFAAILAFVPALLLTTGLISLIIGDEARRMAFAEGIGDVFPPLANVAVGAMDARLEGRINASLIAALGSLWGASTFYGAIDEAFARVFERAPRRSMLLRIRRGMLSVLLLLGLVAVMVILTGVATRMTNIGFLRLGAAFDVVFGLAAPLLAVGVWIGIIYAAYRIVPTVPVSRHAALLPAAAVGVFLAAWTQAMAFLGNFFVGTARELGPGLGVLAVLMWLWVSFNAIIFGLAWVRVREEREAAEVPASVSA
jgi:uncharacterized BrkB/YihY/UPF0761 family membrane protein